MLTGISSRATPLLPRFLGGYLGDFFAWWLRQIRSLPLGRRRPGTRSDAVILAIDALRLEPALAAAGRVLVRRQGRETQNATFGLPHAQPMPALPALRTGLRLPAGMVLRRDVALPMAASRELTSMLTFEMDRLTPFTADELLWSTGPARPSANRDTVKFSLLLVPRQPVEALLAALDQSGLVQAGPNQMGARPSFLECDEGRIELRRHATPAHHRLRAGWALCGVLALACLLAPVIRQQLALNAAARQIAALQPTLAEALALRQHLAAAAAARSAIAAARRDGDALRSLAALTGALPDDTWLSDLTLKSGDLTIDGQSGDAAALIATLTAAPAFHDPRFIAPVTRAADGGADLFSINVTVSP